MTTHKQLNFEIGFLKDKLLGHATVLSNCIFLWLGKDRTDILSLGLGDRSIMLSGQPLPSDAMFVQNINVKLNKLFSGRQVSDVLVIFHHIAPFRSSSRRTSAATKWNLSTGRSFSLLLRAILTRMHSFTGSPLRNKVIVVFRA